VPFAPVQYSPAGFRELFPRVHGLSGKSRVLPACDSKISLTHFINVKIDAGRAGRASVSGVAAQRAANFCATQFFVFFGLFSTK